MDDSVLKKADYEEPRCPLAPPREVVPVPVRRIIEKLDEYLGKNDYEAAARHLKSWLEEARLGGDQRGELTLLNEQIGLYRKLGREEECLQAIGAALGLARAPEFDGSIVLGTTLINAATGFKAFGRVEDALPLYREARDIYESTLPEGDARLGGLYNNMALTVMELGDHAGARTLFEKALGIMARQENGEMEMAITYCNLADLADAEGDPEESDGAVREYLDKAEALLDTPHLPRNGYYAFVCEKCASTFGYYGYFLAEKKFSDRAREIYERA